MRKEIKTMKNLGKTYIITGHYGSGKTEFCVNFALNMQKNAGNKKLYLADLDVINPYFRSREKSALLEANNIEVMGCVLPNNSWHDFPALSYGFLSKIRQGHRVIIDLAGSENGLKPLEYCYEAINEYEFYVVVNTFRPDTASVDQIINFVNNINSMSPLKVSGIINNTNLLHETTSEHIINSQNIIALAGATLDLPIVYTQVKASLYTLVKSHLISQHSIVFDKLQMREDWQ